MRFIFRNKHLKHKTKYLLEVLNWKKLEKSLLLRGQNSKINILYNLINEIDFKSKLSLRKLGKVILKLPNNVHPRVWNYGNEAKEIYRFTPSKATNCKKNLEFSEVCKHFNNIRMEHLGNYTGHKSYYLYGKLAELEQSLVQYTIDVLKHNSFGIISVPDILPTDIIQGCGMHTAGERTQVYKIDSGRCLSGTAEMALAGFFANKIFKEYQLPLKYAAVSRCYRAETSGLNEEKGIYRVHQFTKVEMFSVCSQIQSEEVTNSLKDFEMNIFKMLNLKFRVLDMPPTELGSSAYEKYDIETWMPGRKVWGEISSCSNCTDYQSKRLNIKYIANNGNVHFAHTVNGTASAIPRMLISMIESNQIDKNTMETPIILHSYLNESKLFKERNVPEIKFARHIKHIVNN